MDVTCVVQRTGGDGNRKACVGRVGAKVRGGETDTDREQRQRQRDREILREEVDKRGVESRVAVVIVW